jgi:hypothetical protein
MKPGNRLLWYGAKSCRIYSLIAPYSWKMRGDCKNEPSLQEEGFMHIGYFKGVVLWR